MSTVAAPPLPTPVSQADKEWLQTLDKSTSTTFSDRGLTTRFADRKMSGDEWSRLLVIITAHQLPCVMYRNGHDFGIAVYDHGQIPGETPERLFYFDYWQVPWIERGAVHQHEAVTPLSAITHTERNQQILAWYGFSPMKDPSYYTP